IGRFERNAQSLTTSVPLGQAGPYPYLDWDMENVSKNLRTDLNWVKKLGDGAKLDVKLGATLARGSNDSYRQGYRDRDGELTLDSYVKSRVKEHGYNSTGKYSAPIGKGHALAVGWDGGYTTRDDTRLQREKRARMLTPQNQVPGFVEYPANEQYTADVTRLAAYAQDEWNVTPLWSVYLGVRWEGISTAVSGNDFEDTTARTSVWSPLFQTLYKLPGTKGDQLRFALTRTYKAPALERILPRRWTSSNNFKPTEPDQVGNPELRPELATGIDASYEHYWGKGAMVSVSASVRRLTDYTRTQVAPEIDSNGDTIYVSMPVNDGTATTRGLEFEAKFPLMSVFEKAPAVDVRFNMSRNWSTVSAVTGPNNRLDQQTPFSATLGADYKQGKLTTGASYSFRNGGPVRVSATQDVYTTPRRDLEMYGLWKFDAKNQLRVGLTNILAQDYISEATYTYANGSGASRRSTFTPGETLLRATMEMKF
ncbi:MAG: TonB-dependent receptor, partial [Telluria sp.]